MTTSLSRCHECAALLPDIPEDRRTHLSHHRDIAKKLEAQRQRVGALSSDVLRLVDQIRDFRKTLDSHPINAEPTEITVNDIPDDEIDDFDDDQGPYTGEPVEDPTDLDATTGYDPTQLYPAIDRDDLDTRLANATGTAPTITPGTTA